MSVKCLVLNITIKMLHCYISVGLYVTENSDFRQVREDGKDKNSVVSFTLTDEPRHVDLVPSNSKEEVRRSFLTGACSSKTASAHWNVFVPAGGKAGSGVSGWAAAFVWALFKWVSPSLIDPVCNTYCLWCKIKEPQHLIFLPLNIRKRRCDLDL